MNRLKLKWWRGSQPAVRSPGSWALVAAILTVAWFEGAQAGSAFGTGPVRAPGGLSPRPQITSMTASNKQVTLTWSGFGGPYKIERCPGAGSQDWKQISIVTNALALTFPLEGDLGFLRVNGPAPTYAGAETCLDCHSSSHADWSKTAHASALASLKAIGQDKNPACLACHTVGYGLPTGFSNEATTPLFAGVQCESCHGPAGAHALKPGDKSLRPGKSLSANVCGGCHTDAHHPTFDEWAESKHAHVSAELVTSIVSTGESRMLTCGACHSGSVRLAMLRGAETSKPVVLPSRQEAVEVGITCAVCHDPHVKTANGRQLRNPIHSGQGFSYSTATNTTFAAQYDAKLNVCGQCHNARGATWKDTSRPPHYSPQYNMLTATIGFLVGTNAARQSAHATQIVNQCSHCHTHPHEVADPSENNPNYTGHEFKPSLVSCYPCHIDEADAKSKLEATQSDIKRRIQDVKSLLDQWATTAADATLRTKYGARAWEYNNFGHVTDPTGALAAAGARGPTTAEQNVVPDEIKQARFNMYLVDQDGSYGVHNTKYAQDLLKVAGDLVKAKLAPPAVKPASVGNGASGSGATTAED